MQVPHVVYLLSTPRGEEAIMTAWLQILLGLPTINDRWYDPLLRRREHITLDMVWHEGLVQFFITIPARLAPQVAALISGWLPEAIVAPQAEDPLVVLYPQQQQLVAGSHFRPTRSALKQLVLEYPSDPLVGLYAHMSSLPLDMTALLQVVLSPVMHSQKKMVSAAAAPESTTGTTPPLSAPEKAFTITWRAAAAGTNAQQLQSTIISLAAAFNTFTQSDRRFFYTPKIVYGQTALNRIFSRTHSWISKTVVPAKLAAASMHPPGIDMANLSNIAWGKALPGEPPASLPVVHKNMPLEKKQLINPFATTVFKNQPVIYGLNRPDRRRHLYVIGKTGTGKSTLLANLAINDLKNDEGLCVIDPHGDLVETLLDFIPSRRINDVIYFDPSDSERTVKLNLFEGHNVVHRELIASGIVSVFRKLYGYSWGPRLEHILRNSLLTLLKADDARLSDITDLLTGPDFRRKIVDNLDDPILKNFWINEFNSMQEKLRTEAVAPVLNKVGQFVSSPLVRDVVNARKSSFSIEEVMDQGKILLVNLSQGRLGEDNATLLGAMLITKIQLAAMGRVHQPEEQRRDFYLYVDEFQNFATDSFSKILSEARKYRLNLTLANQYSAQIPEEVQSAIFGNCGSVAAFVMGAQDASLFSQEFSGKYTPQDLVTLQKHQIINRIAIDNVISEAFPAFTLPLASSRNQNRPKVLRSSRERYAKQKS